MHQAPLERFDAVSQNGDQRTGWNRMIHITTGSSNPHANTNGSGKGNGNANEDEKDVKNFYVQDMPISVIVPKNNSLLSCDSAYGKYIISSNAYSSSENNSQAGNAQNIIQSGMIDDSNTLLISITTWRNTNKEGTIIENTGCDGGEFGSDTLCNNNCIKLWIQFIPKSIHTPYVNHKTNKNKNWNFIIMQQLNMIKINIYFAVINITKNKNFPLPGHNGNIDGSMGMVTGISMRFGTNTGDGHNNNNNSNDMGFTGNSHSDDRYNNNSNNIHVHSNGVNSKQKKQMNEELARLMKNQRVEYGSNVCFFLYLLL